MFQRDFVALGENQTRGWLQLCLDPPLSPPLDPPHPPLDLPHDPPQRIKNDPT